MSVWIRRLPAVSLALALTVVMAACANKGGSKGSAKATADDLVAKILRTFPHDRKAFTQGLLFYEGHLYESTGLQGQSTLRRVDLETGVVQSQVTLEAPLFGEGLARVGT